MGRTSHASNVSDLLLWGVPLAILAAGILRPSAGLAVFAASLVLFGALTFWPHTTGDTEVGVRTVKWSPFRASGVLPDAAAPATAGCPVLSSFGDCEHPPNWSEPAACSIKPASSAGWRDPCRCILGVVRGRSPLGSSPCGFRYPTGSLRPS